MSKSEELARLKSVMKDLGISANKAFGQNFLINPKVIKNIVSHFDLNDQSVVEVGPGLGALTSRLSVQSQKIKLIEFDKKLVSYWQDLNFDVESVDALKFNWQGLPSEFEVLISNLPYQISASLVINLSYMNTPIERMVLMFQKEVAQRIQSAWDKKSYGIISVLAQNTWSIKKVADLSQGDFFPKPKVCSRVLAFEKKNDRPELDIKFLKFVKHCFMDRRKIVINKLKSYNGGKSFSKIEIEGILEELNLDKNVRAENISPKNFVLLYGKITGKL